MEPDARAGAPPEHQIAPDQQPVAVLEELIHARGERLLHAAVLLAGSHADGEDLLQAALERVFRHWRRIDGDPEAYHPSDFAGTRYVTPGPYVTPSS